MSLLCSGKEAKLPVDLKIRSKHSLFAVPHGRSARATYRKLHCCISLQFRSKKSLVISCVGFKNTDDMFLVKKYTTRHSNSNSKPSPEESTRKKVTEQELDHLNSKIDKLLSKLDEHEPEPASHQDEECVVCVSAKATMQTFPCGHKVICRKCFVKTIQMAVAQRMLPLRCVVCRTKILRLIYSDGSSTDSNKSTLQSYHVPQSTSLFSVSSSNSSSSSASKGSNHSTSCVKSKASNESSRRTFGKSTSKSHCKVDESTVVHQSTRSCFAKLTEKKSRIAPAPTAVVEPVRGKLSLIQEFRREFISGKVEISCSKDLHAERRVHFSSKNNDGPKRNEPSKRSR